MVLTDWSLTASRQAKIIRNATSQSKGRRGNDACRVREHLTEAEMDKLLAALKRNRHGHRDWLIGLIIYRHGPRARLPLSSRGHSSNVSIARSQDQKLESMNTRRPHIDHIDRLEPARDADRQAFVGFHKGL
jgi:hypothetical protein